MSLKNIDRDTGLTPEEIGDLSGLTNFVISHPQTARAVIEKSGYTPGQTPDVMVMQIARASLEKPEEFGHACEQVEGDYEDFLGGAGAAVLALGKKVGGIFKKGSGAGKKVKGFFNRIFDKDARQEWKAGREGRRAARKLKRETSKANREQEKMEEEAYDERGRAREDDESVVVTDESGKKTTITKADVDKLEKTNKTLMIGLIAAGAAFLGVLIWAFAS